MHPDGISDSAIVDGQLVQVQFEHGMLEAAMKAEKAQRRGVFSMAHLWSMVDDTTSNSGASISSDAGDLTPINYMPRQSAIPIHMTATPPTLREPAA